MTVLQYNKLVRVCDRGVLRYKQRRLIDKNSPERLGGQTRKEGTDILIYGMEFTWSLLPYTTYHMKWVSKNYQQVFINIFQIVLHMASYSVMEMLSRLSPAWSGCVRKESSSSKVRVSKIKKEKGMLDKKKKKRLIKKIKNFKKVRVVTEKFNKEVMNKLYLI